MSNLLKDNAFHVLGLDTSASQKDILKRSKDIVRFIQIDELPTYDLDLDTFKNFRTEESVKDAIQKLTSPKKQIKEYFFWFNIADQNDEQAVGILRMKKPEDALMAWEHHASGESTKALFYKKNLALLYCLLLFKEDNQHYLKASLKLWKEIVTSDKFWSTFSKVYKLNDELNTNQETIDEFEKNCISYVADLYTEIAEARKDYSYVSEFSAVFNTKGEKTSKDLLTPIFNEMSVAIEKLETLKVTEDGFFSKEKSTVLKENVSIIQGCCNKLLELGLYEDSESRLMRDRAGNALRSISIDLNNDLNETSVALGLAKISDQISGTEGFKNKLKQDLKQIEDNDTYKTNEKKFNAVIDPIVATFKAGNSAKALKTINEYIYNDATDPELKKSLKEIKEVIEERITKNGTPVPNAPTMASINGIGSKMYGDTLWFIILFIPFYPIARYKVEVNGKYYSFLGKLPIKTWQTVWRIVVIIGVVVFGLIALSGS
jgi:CRISPR/Cas system CSM-associated protein Csm2 small subunit